MKRGLWPLFWFIREIRGEDSDVVVMAELGLFSDSLSAKMGTRDEPSEHDLGISGP